MQKQFIGTLVAAIIIFLWQFLSWAALNIHGSETMHTPNQEAILKCLADNNLQPGSYFLPQAAPGEDQEAAMKAAEGKPWALISYHASMNTGMGMNMIRGFAVDLVAAFLLVWLLMNFKESGLKISIYASLAVGAIAYLTIPYLNSIWFETNTTAYLIDWAAQWGLVGAWLGWWLNRS